MSTRMAMVEAKTRGAARVLDSIMAHLLCMILGTEFSSEYSPRNRDLILHSGGCEQRLTRTTSLSWNERFLAKPTALSKITTQTPATMLQLARMTGSYIAIIPQL